MQNLSIYLANGKQYLSQGKRLNGSFLAILLGVMFCFFIVSGIEMMRDLWSLDVEKTSLIDPNYESINGTTPFYSWQAEGTAPLQVKISENPDIKNEKVLSIQRTANPGWSGIAKSILGNNPLSIQESIELQIKNNGPAITFYIEFIESQTPSNPIPESWQKDYRLDSGSWNKIQMPLSALYLKPYEKEIGKIGNQQLDLESMKEIGLLFPPDCTIQLILGAVQINHYSFSWTLSASLFLNLFWWMVLFYYAIRHPISLSNSLMMVESSKFLIYQSLIILSPNHPEMGLTLCLAIAYSLFESIYYLLSPQKLREPEILAQTSPWIIGVIVLYLSPTWTLIPLLAAVHCFQIIIQKTRHSLEWTMVHFILILLAGHFGAKMAIQPIPISVGLVSLFALYFLSVEQKKYLNWEKGQKNLQNLFEQQIQYSQTMEAIGQLSRGMSHEFNNLLTGIIGNLRLMQLRKNQDTTDHIQKALDSAYQAADTIKKLQIFSHLSKINTQSIDLNPLILEAKKLFEKSIDPSIHFRYQSDDSILILQADPLRLKSVLLNLLINARDAIEKDSQILPHKQHSISLETTIIDGLKTPNGTDPKINRYVRISVADNGIGMDSQTSEHIFDPFFTAKEVGMGTGLGLACANEIIKQHKGLIEVESQLHEGTTFHIYLPLNGTPS